MATQSFGKIEAIKYGWTKVKKNFLFFVGLLLISGLASLIPSFVAGLFEEGDMGAIGLILTLVGWGLQLTISLGMIGIALKLHDNKKAEYKNLFDYLQLVIPYLFSSILYGLIVIGGFILLVIPGIIWSIKFRYFSYFMVDENLGPIESLKASAKITEGHKWNLFLFGLLLALLNIAGFLLFFVGIFITAPISMMAEAYVFRKLSSK